MSDLSTTRDEDPPLPAHRVDASRLQGRHARRMLIVLAAYALLTLILTYPLLLHLTTHIPGTNVDEGNFLWNTWWVKHSLIDLHSNPFYSSLIFYPVGMSTALYTMAWLNCFLGLPLTLASGAILGTNIPTLLGFVLSAFGMYLLALDRLPRAGRGLRTELAAFVAGIVYAFVSAHFLYAVLGQGDYVNTQWLPLAALYFLRMLERPGRRAPVLAALFGLFAAWTELNFVVYMLVFGITVLFFAALTRAVVFSRALLARLALASVVFAVGFAPLGVPVVVESVSSGASLVQGWGYADMLVFDLLGPFVPSPLHPLLGLSARQITDRFSDRQFAFVGYSVLVLTFAGILIGRRWAHVRKRQATGLRSTALWAVVGGIFFLFALGPLLHVNGQWNFDLDGLTVNIPLPYIVIHYLPFLQSSRVPGRFGIVATMAAAMLVAFACRAIMARLDRRSAQIAVTALVSGLIIFENLALPLPLVNAVPPPPYDRIAQEAGDFAILQVPLGWRDGWHLIGPERTLIQAYQMAHEKAILAGNGSRVPGETFDYFTRAPVVTSILNYEEGRTEDAAILAGDRALAPSALSFLNVRYIVIHGEYVGALVDRYVQDVLPVERVAAAVGDEESPSWDGGFMGKWLSRGRTSTAWVLYRVLPAPQGPPLSVDLGTDSAHLHQISGWSYDEMVGDATAAWVDGKNARALIRLDQPAAARLSLRAVPFSYDNAPLQNITVVVNGHVTGSFDMASGWSDYRVEVPAVHLRRGMNEIRLSFRHTASPATVMGTSDRRNLAAAIDWIRLEIEK